MNCSYFLTVSGAPLIVGQTKEYRFSLDANAEVLVHLALNKIQEVVVLFKRFDTLWSVDLLDYYQDQGILASVNSCTFDTSHSEYGPHFLVSLTGLIKIFPLRFFGSVIHKKPVLQFVYNFDSVYSDEELLLANKLIKSFLISNYYALPEKLRIVARNTLKPLSQSNLVVALATELRLVEEDYDDFYHHFDLLEQALFLIEHYRIIFEDHDANIEKNIRESIEEQQKRFMITEKIRMLQKMLGEDSDEDSAQKIDIDEDPFESLRIPFWVRKTIKSETKKANLLYNSSPEVSVSKTYVDILLRLPWRLCDDELLEITKVREVLDRDHYGLVKVKERLINFLSSRIFRRLKSHTESQTNSEIKTFNKRIIDLNLFSEQTIDTSSKDDKHPPTPILVLLGPPGVGKTSLVRSIAEALGRKYIKISLGGTRDESDIRGHRRTYVSAMPGKIIKALLNAGTSNPVILLDEIDKIASHSHYGDVASALLEVLDPEQNQKFQDNYLEFEYDLSRVLFIATANYIEQIPTPLKDRVEIIELSSYTLKEKLEITKQHIIPKALKSNSLPTDLLVLSDDEIKYVIEGYTLEAGVRSLQRIFNFICQQAIANFLIQKTNLVVEIKGGNVDANSFVLPKITFESVKEYLKSPRFRRKIAKEEFRIGTITGLAYTSVGGSILPIEVITYAAKESSGLTVTGLAAQVMKESAAIAHGFVKGNAKYFGVQDFEFNSNQVHFHVPEGATPKDGPSAGVTFVTSLISYLTQTPVSSKVAMTGEITLQGNILQIGGLKEKTLAAQIHGVEKVFIPKQNEPDIKDLPNEVKDNITFIPVSHYNEIFEYLFAKKTSPSFSN